MDWKFWWQSFLVDISDISCLNTAILRYLLCKKNEPELSLHFLVTSYDGQGHVYKRKIIRGADLEKTYIWVILYYKIDHFCPLKSNFHPFLAIWPNDWVWNSLLPGCYHLLVQVRLARSLFFPLGTNYWAKSKPRCKKYEGFFGNQGYFWAINQYSITFIGVKKERKGFLHVLLVPKNDKNQVIVNSRPNIGSYCRKWVKITF